VQGLKHGVDGQGQGGAQAQAWRGAGASIPAAEEALKEGPAKQGATKRWPCRGEAQGRKHREGWGWPEGQKHPQGGEKKTQQACACPDESKGHGTLLGPADLGPGTLG